MSEIPSNLPSSLPLAGPSVPSAQAKAAQAAFFRAALGEVQAAASPRPQATTTVQASEPESPRLPRPGQLLDIRV